VPADRPPSSAGLFEGIGGWITYASSGDVYAVAPAQPTVPRLLLDLPRGPVRPLSWSSDGRELLVVRIDLGKQTPPSRLFVLGDDGSVRTVPGTVGSPSGTLAPDGTIVFEQPLADHVGSTRIARVDLDTGSITGVGRPPRAGADWSPAVGPDERIAALHVNQGAVSIDLVSGPRTTIVPSSALPKIIDVSGLAWSPDGSRLTFGLYTDDKSLRVFVVDADGSHLREISGDAAFPSWSPDGSRISFVRSSDWMLMSAAPGGGAVSELGVVATPSAHIGVAGPWNPAPPAP
jgi:Tol biopolymer transport system component